MRPLLRMRICEGFSSYADAGQGSYLNFQQWKLDCLKQIPDGWGKMLCVLRFPKIPYR